MFYINNSVYINFVVFQNKFKNKLSRRNSDEVMVGRLQRKPPCGRLNMIE